MSGVNKFSGEGQGKIHHIVVSEVSSTIANEKTVPSDKFTPSEEVEKGTIILNDMEEPVHMISGKDFDNFQGHSTTSIGWFNIDHEWLKRKNLHLN